MPVKPVPDGYHTVTPYLTVADADKLIQFVEKAFGGTNVFSHRDDNGRIRHAEVKLGDSMLMIGEAGGPWPARPTNLYLYVENVDDLYKRAVAAGAKSVMEPANQFYGDRNAGVEDSNGNQWWIATHVEDVSPEEMQRRMAQAATK